jgi:hypothetical protein
MAVIASADTQAAKVIAEICGRRRAALTARRAKG